MRSKIAYCALALGGALLAATGDARAQDITVPLDEARLIHLEQPVSDVIVGNPSIADIAVQNGQLLVVTGKSFGMTNLIVLDARGEEIVNRNLRVRSPSARTVRMHKGGARFSYDCPERCETMLVPGDNSDFSSAVSTGIREKIGVAQSAAEGDAGGSQ